MKCNLFFLSFLVLGVSLVSGQNHDTWQDDDANDITTSTLESYHSAGTSLFPIIQMNYSSDNTSQNGGSQNRMGTVFRDYSIINDGLFKITYSEDGSNVSNILSLSTGQSTFKTPLKVEGSSLLEGLTWMKDDALLETGNLAIGVGIGSLNGITDRIHLNGSMAITNQNYLEFGKGLEKDEEAGKILYNDETNMLEIFGGGLTAAERKINFRDKVIIGDKISSSHPDSKLEVEGKITANKVIVTTDNWVWPDYVFEEDYKVQSLKEIEDYIKSNGHLPEVPNQKEVNSTGIDVGEMNAILLKKIEEMTLLLIDMQNQIDNLKNSK
ncbi:MAG: hypothetical protein RH860_12410 [Cytophagales bacterium]